MRSSLGTGAVALALLLSGCGGSDDGASLNAAAANSSAPLTQIAAPNNGDWTQIVSETPEGGFRVGNPDAPVKLVEYASITCPHCGDFSANAAEPLMNTYVRSGQVSWEYRPFMLFPSDPAIFMLLRCQGPTPFFTLTEQLYAAHDDWLNRLQTLPPEQAQQLQSMAPTDQARAIIQATGLDQFFRQRGMPEARINACLADNSQLERLAQITREGSEQHGVTGTPSFFINGEKLDVGDWAGLQPRLRAAIGG
ncbi:thioredoxin domain-containing protein [Sphingosinicella terrae]|uniref:thioredoxin domain-containing protein n=1 Tax=Sphingosinicella terrae TaxID=2172047 RepID=UPI000E0CC274|nr:thioredoxin domain-containing protein [Sphingosinicella terrae]